MRLLAAAGALLVGMLLGGWLMLTAQDASSRATPPGAAPTSPVPPATTQPTTAAPIRPESAPKEPPPQVDQVLLVWTPGRLPDGFTDRVADLPEVSAVTTVRAGILHLAATVDSTEKAAFRPPSGFVIPIEAMSFDPSIYPDLLPDPDSNVLEALEAHEVILGSTSARLRGVGSGSEMLLEDGTSLRVTEVVNDLAIGAAEVAMTHATGEELGLDTGRYLLVRHSGSRKDVERAIRSRLPDGAAVRIRAPGETPVLRHGDAVLPQVRIKEVFGEFAYRPTGDGTFDVDPSWREESIVTADIPLLGTLRCHRNMVNALRGAMEQLAERNLASLIQQSQGCYNPRFIAGGKGISRHAWGAAVDINIGANPEGLESVQDPRLLEVMERWGFTSGHEWLIPDPGHFEYVRPPD